jgi:hypothetical protein
VAFTEYKKRRDELERPKLPPMKRRAPKSNMELLSDWLRKNGNRDLANFLNKPVETLARMNHLHGIYRVLRTAHLESNKRKQKHPFVDTKPEIRNEYGSNDYQKRFQAINRELARRNNQIGNR